MASVNFEQDTQIGYQLHDQLISVEGFGGQGRNGEPACYRLERGTFATVEQHGDQRMESVVDAFPVRDFVAGLFYAIKERQGEELDEDFERHTNFVTAGIVVAASRERDGQVAKRTQELING